MERDITLRIVLEAPPPGVDFGVQKGRGSAFETIQTQRSTDARLADGSFTSISAPWPVSGTHRGAGGSRFH